MTEKTTALTDAMIKALATLADSTGQPVELKNSSVIDALLQRKFVLHTNPTPPSHVSQNVLHHSQR